MPYNSVRKALNAMFCASFTVFKDHLITSTNLSNYAHYGKLFLPVKKGCGDGEMEAWFPAVTPILFMTSLPYLADSLIKNG